MSELIKQMSTINLPQELLNEVDIVNIGNEFHQNFKKLEDFSRTRDKYEKRGLWEKLWDVITFDNTLKNAQFDAIEVQSKFNKSLGQLMYLSVIQSQLLDSQQKEMAKQQGEIKLQTASLENHTSLIESQHKELASQSRKLQDTLNGFIELKGFTQNELKTFVAIANDVKLVRDNLQKFVADSLSVMSDKVNAKTNEVTNQVEIVKGQISAVQENNKILEAEFRSTTEGIVEQSRNVSLELKDSISSVSAASELRDLNNSELAKNNLQEVDASLRSNDESVKKLLIAMMDEHKAEQQKDLGRLRWSLGFVSFISLVAISYLAFH